MSAWLTFRDKDGVMRRVERENPVRYARALLVAGLRLVSFEVHGRCFPVHPEESMRRAVNRLQREHAQGVLL